MAPADERLIISFAPNTLAYAILKRIGELFPGPSKVRVDTRLFAGTRWGRMLLQNNNRLWLDWWASHP